MFDSYADGYNALLNQLNLYANGTCGMCAGQPQTISGTFSIYAPAGQGSNNPTVYAQNVAAALGVSSLFFNHVFNYGNADNSFPLFVFVFLVALGISCQEVIIPPGFGTGTPNPGVRKLRLCDCPLPTRTRYAVLSVVDYLIRLNLFDAAVIGRRSATHGQSNIYGDGGA